MTNKQVDVYFFQERVDKIGSAYFYGIQLVVDGKIDSEQHIFKTGNLDLTQSRLIEVGKLVGENIKKLGVRDYGYHPYEKKGNSERLVSRNDSNVVFFRDDLKKSIDLVVNSW